MAAIPPTSPVRRPPVEWSALGRLRRVHSGSLLERACPRRLSPFRSTSTTVAGKPAPTSPPGDCDGCRPGEISTVPPRQPQTITPGATVLGKSPTNMGELGTGTEFVTARTRMPVPQFVTTAAAYCAGAAPAGDPDLAASGVSAASSSATTSFVTDSSPPTVSSTSLDRASSRSATVLSGLKL